MIQTEKDMETFFAERNKLGIKPGLERMHFLLKELHHPEKSLKVIHVAGTNGKGSTVHYIKNALIASGYTVGVFTSPSFTGLTGHFFIQHQQMAQDDLFHIIRKLHPIILKMDEQQMHPTVFEILTAVSFLYFKDRVDIVLIEAGMGGRFDTTNVVMPMLSIITNVAQDHMHFLGESEEEIAFHKAGIIKKRCPVIVGRVGEAAANVIREEALNQAPLFELEKDFWVEKNQHTYKWVYKDRTEIPFSLQMKGAHQQENAAVALMALFLLQSNDFVMRWEKVTKSMYETQVPGRFETVHTNPTIILDSAHNVASITAFLQTVHAHDIKGKRHLLFAGFRDKQLTEMLDLLKEAFDAITLTTFDHERAASTSELTALFADEFKIEEDFKSVVTNILQNEQYIKDTYYITGSLHFITLVRAFLT